MEIHSEPWPFKPQHEFLIDYDELTWLAGYYEGEGTLYIQKSHQTLNEYVCIQLKSTDRDTMEYAASLLGKSCMGPYYPAMIHHKNYFNISIARMQDVADFCYNMWPFLFERRRQQIFNGMTIISNRL